MTIFYAAVEDDPLDTGGRVIEGGPIGNIQGEDGKYRRMAYLGQKAWCSQCKTAGTIVAAPGSPSKKRINDKQRRRQQALGGDLVICKCERHPRIVPIYGRKCKILPDGGSAASESTAQVRSFAEQPARHDEQFTLRDQQTGNPLTSVVYRITSSSGAVYGGMTDENGRTQRIQVGGAESLRVEIRQRSFE